ncbi:MAG: hypothetical protein KGK01_12505 [Bradyrhizobium sp.]|uniref:hypothetical protein n=1 Tax=Bradyrhizobium sp. TaxID=376 RepID=UPI001C2982FA|nr:hypothetical protein [Bradyrhizobium sp.]MBU6464046.1 hypothetical protein [Pseudomonadota bacterium]MDE2066407.1 hypothetical protein [Bradyrhizobium sp.]MDE2243222.1 hypothetical protein [Bradyrhizobium sp.]
MNKWSVAIGLEALILGMLMWTAYLVVGWHHFEMPHTNIIVSIFHFDGEAAEDAIYFEAWLEYVAAAAILLTGAHLLFRRISN